MNVIPTARCTPRRRTIWASAALSAAVVAGAPTVAAADDSPSGTHLPSCGAPASSGAAAGRATTGSRATTGDGDHTTGSTDDALAWAPPQLDHPTTVHITSRTTSIKLNKKKDYVLDLPDKPVYMDDGLSVYGGHDVVLIGGQITTRHRGLALKSQTGTVHVEGLHLAGKATEGIDLQEGGGATVQLENILVDTVHGHYSGNHADVIQSWAGPGVLRVDRLDGSTTYQGFFLDPMKFGHAVPKGFDLRDVVLRDANARSAYLLWQSGTFPITTQDVTVVHNPHKTSVRQFLHTKDGQSSWAGVDEGDASTPSPLTGDPGTDYVSPGYDTDS